MALSAARDRQRSVVKRMSQPPRFLFVTCQVGAEPAVKRELAGRWPDFRFAYSRPGFLTFKLPVGHRLLADFDLESVFARAYGFCLGKVTGENVQEMARAVWELYGGRPVRRVHVWHRDTAEPGENGFQPSSTPTAVEAEEAIRRHCPGPDALTQDADDPAIPAQRGEFVQDCVLVEPQQWWVGYHRVKSTASRWPGGTPPLELPPEAVSRAWLKMEEALRWSELPIAAGGRCVEIGSAPGGTSQALLAHGLTVTGVDPAAMHPAVLNDPRFTHVRRRAREVRRREFRKVRWLTADMNVAPKYALDVVEEIVTHRDVNVRGLLLMLKLPDWKLANRLPGYLERVRSWGYNVVRARQLRYNRREVCVAALKRPFVRSPARRRR